MQECPRCRVINTDLVFHCEGCGVDLRNPANELRPATFWDRFKALWLDALFLVAAVYLPLGLARRPNQKPPSLPIAFWLISGLYFTAMESSRWQATLGKQIVGLKVTDLAGNRVSFWRAGTRNLGRLTSSIFAIGYCLMFMTKRKQTLHDLMAGCLVLKPRPRL